MLSDIDLQADTAVQADQAGAIPFRRNGGDLEFCLITLSKGRNWGFPKGNVDAGSTPVETALQEAHEEAGLLGQIFGDRLGIYRHKKRSSKIVTVAVYLMEVERSEDDWSESDQRERRWVTASQALELLRRQALKDLLRLAVERCAQHLNLNDK